MFLRASIIAVGALCCLFSGCGCSKEERDDGIPARMEDAVYTNQLAQFRARQASAASRAAAIREKIRALGAGAEGTPEYVDLTNKLAQCEVESERIRKSTLNAIRTRIMKESVQKGNLKK